MVKFLDEFVFLRIVKKYDGDKYVKHFSCWNQLLTLMFGQLTGKPMSCQLPDCDRNTLFLIQNKKNIGFLDSSSPLFA